ncbi:hypothetical protein CC86DRAFT_427514 [Ophiobolus disseminans]|uniref:Uncharacterized protein n=1 Tax=Ophiobolus disseminans TaxID=1469910 RepID=A0A6A6ZKI1_9PLEO|nr:hypothetical protein CC86DRAFT_427514 [Ophiobolus disseminans]
MGSPLAKNNAFGAGSPSWNLSFPHGNLTAAEILAYLPHWLKSVDVVDRFITNGGKSYTIAAMINEFRYLPGDENAVFRPNSVQIMMSYGMRRAGFDEWTVGTHHKFERPNPDLDETNLSVGTFRPPRSTHPKNAAPGQSAKTLKSNEEADPIQFKDLVIHIKKHPSGSDALDLSRCVQHAITHPKEDWYFPDDFQALLKKLGGPAAVTHAHLDRQVFSRRDDYSRRVTSHSTPPVSGSPLKRMMTADAMALMGSRKSGRLASKATPNLKEYDSDATDNDIVQSPYAGFDTPTKKRKLHHIAATPGAASNDSDFVQDDSEADDVVPEAEIVSEDEPVSPVNAARSRAAARKAREVILNISNESQLSLKNLIKHRETDFVTPMPNSLMLPPPRPNFVVNPDIMSLARNFFPGQSMYLKPPVLSEDRLRVDHSTVYAYAADGCTTLPEIWNSALSSTRFNGPRRSPPFRELHRLTDPHHTDLSDWAENIRWAKEQFRVYGSQTWTEYDYHLEMITSHRRMLWASEYAIARGM